MPIDIYDNEFQNWLKGVLGLNMTRTALCECISDTFQEYVNNIPHTELSQFFICLKSNQIARLKTQRKKNKQWECKHDSCRVLMDRFVDNHTEKHILGYNWNFKSSGDSLGNTDLSNEDKNLTWNVIVLYMHVDKNESAENYSSLECLDISHVIKVMRNCKLLSPDGSAEPYDEVIKSRNKLMHSPNNKMNEKETENILKWTRKLLDCLKISEKRYYKDAIQYLNDLEEKDFVIRYQSEENKKILAEVLEAKDIADTLYQDIGDKNQQCKSKSKQLQEKLERIGGSRAATNKGWEMEPTEYKSIVKETLEKKQDTIVQDKAECDRESEDYKKLEILEQKTVNEIQEVEEVMQKPEPEEMAERIDSLNKAVETLKDENQQTKAKEIRLKKKTEEQAQEIENLTRNVESIVHEKSRIEKEVEKYRMENETLKANTSMHLRNGNDSQFQRNIDSIPKFYGNEGNDNEPISYSDEEEETDGSAKENEQIKFAKEDVKEYQDGYPDQEDNTGLNKNYEFFMNRIPSEPEGDYIDNIHVLWWGDYKKLEEDRKYMQWLFPIRAKSCNRRAQELFPHEIQKILESEKARNRLLASYKMMLDFYGMKLDNEEDGRITRSEHWEERFENLNRSEHNYNRVTRILKCLGELGFEYLKMNFTKFILTEIIEKKQLENLRESCLNYWVELLKSPTERVEMKKFYRQMLNRNQRS